MIAKYGDYIWEKVVSAGVYASHGYERSHRDGAVNTLKVLVEYLQ